MSVAVLPIFAIMVYSQMQHDKTISVKYMRVIVYVFLLSLIAIPLFIKAGLYDGFSILVVISPVLLSPWLAPWIVRKTNISGILAGYHAREVALNSFHNKNIDLINGKEFELYCVELLRAGDWNAETTKASGDQGVDIVATRKGIKCVFQVKKLNKPVGNKAVQEAYAGMRYYGDVNFGFVVTNNEYTSSAKDLAKVTGVHLIHYSELCDLSKYIRT